MRRQRAVPSGSGAEEVEELHERLAEQSRVIRGLMDQLEEDKRTFSPIFSERQRLASQVEDLERGLRDQVGDKTPRRVRLSGARRSTMTFYPQYNSRARGG